MGESSCSIEVSQLGCVIRYGGKADRSRGGEVVCNERWRSSAAAAYLTPVRSLFLRRTQARSLDSFVPAKCVAPSFELQPWPWFQLACYKNPATTCEFLPSDSSPLSNHLIAFPSPILNYNLIVPITETLD